jgi:hypothetical protein
MKKLPRLKKYAELFRRSLSKFLAPGIHVRTVIYPVDQDGAVFEFLLNKEADETENVERTRPTVGAVLGSIPQRLFAGQIEGVRFGGTNISLEDNRILVIKGGDSPNEWSGNAVISDVRRVVSTSLGSKSE